MPTRQAITIGAVIAGTAALATGCGSSAPPATTTQSSHSPAQAAFAFARCMHEHGVSNFPDPQVTTTPGGGSVSIRQVMPASVAASPAFKSAQKACAALQPGPGRGPESRQGPHKQTLLAFARCLRANGVSGFPDPTAQGQLTLTMIQSAGVDLHARSFITAASRCVGVTHGAITMAQVAAAVNGRH